MANEHLQLDRKPEPMPATVLAAVVLVAIYVLVDLVDAMVRASLVGGIVSAILAGLILTGLLRRHALAWQWGIFMPILAAINGLSILTYAKGAIQVGLAVTFLAIDLAIPLLLMLAPSRAYFGLICPRCGSRRTGANDFLFTGRRCKECHVEWRYR